jgi:hypothetical protein
VQLLGWHRPRRTLSCQRSLTKADKGRYFLRSVKHRDSVDTIMVPVRDVFGSLCMWSVKCNAR